MVDALMHFAFCTVYFTLPIFIYLAMKEFGIDILKFGIESFVIINCILFGYLGIFFLYFGMDLVRRSTGIIDTQIISWVFIASTWSILCLGLGMSAASKFYPFKKIEIKSYTQMSAGQNTALGILLLICCFVFYLYARQFDEYAIFSMFGESVIDAQEIRSQMTNNFQGKYHWYSVFMHQMMWCISCISFSSILIGRNIYNIIAFTISLVFMIAATAITGEKSPTIYYVLSIFLTYIYVKMDGNLLSKRIIAAVIIAFISLFAIYSLHYNKSALESIGLVFSRAFTGGITPAYLYLSYFPLLHDFLLGQSFPNPGGLLSHVPYRLTVEIMNWYTPQNPMRGIVGSAPTIFWGELYANFGFWGVAIVPIFVGAWVGCVAALLRSLPASPMTAGLIVWSAFHFSKLSSGGVFSFIFDYNLVIVTTLVGMVAVMGKTLDWFYIKWKSGK